MGTELEYINKNKGELRFKAGENIIYILGFKFVEDDKKV